MPTRCLSFHSTYRCRHEGACCRAEWEIDVDPAIASAVKTGRIIPMRSTAQPFAPATDGELGTLRPSRTPEGLCGFRVAHRCSLQIVGGESMLPSACRHFPRVYLQDARGSLLTLSHYCPTAAGMLLEDDPIAVVEAEPPLALLDSVEGLDARDALPPLVRPGMLMDVDGYSAWELAVVDAFGTCDDVGRAVEQVAVATEWVRAWHPSDGPLAERIGKAFARARATDPPGFPSEGFKIVQTLTGPHPHMQIPPDVVDRWQALRALGGPVLQRALARYLAACTFANWIAYRGQGLRTIVEWLRACHDVVRLQFVREAGRSPTVPSRESMIAAFRASDFILVHTVDSLAFGRAAAALERP